MNLLRFSPRLKLMVRRLGIHLFQFVALFLFTGCAIHHEAIPVKSVEVKRTKPVVIYAGKRSSYNHSGSTDLARTTQKKTQTKELIQPKDSQAWAPINVSPNQFNLRPEAEGVALKDRTQGKAVLKNMEASRLTYIVKPGDTLFSIAKASKTSVQEISQMNKMLPPYRIQIGQQISLAKKPKLDESNKKSAEIAHEPTKKYEKLYSTGENAKKSNKKLQLDKKVVYEKNRFLSAKKETIKSQAGLTWVWPVKGKLLSKFSKPGSKGVDIAGDYGQAVIAAADGKVVYAGDDVVGYGNLIILQHQNGFLTAYAHNSRLLVKEGNLVKVGQQIAEIGSSGTDRNKLHFEIRKQGRPVDPLSYLPSKQS